MKLRCATLIALLVGSFACSDAAPTHDAAAGSGGTAAIEPGALDFSTLDACNATLTELFSQDAIDPPLGGSGVFKIEAPHAWHDADTDIETTEMFVALEV